MELQKELIEAQKLSEDQVKAINTAGVDWGADLKKKYDTDYQTTANENVEKIISGATDLVGDSTSIKRNQGEKAGDYFARAWSESNTSKSEALAESQKALDDKIKNFKGDTETKDALEKMKLSFDTLQKKEATFDELINGGFQDKFKDVNGKYEVLLDTTSFNLAKPKFSDSANQYEADAKWKTFKDEVLAKHTVVIVDDQPIAIDKENEHKRYPLKDLVAKDSDLQGLITGRQQKGPGGGDGAGKTVKFDDIPFEIPENASSVEISNRIREHLATKGLKLVDPKYSEAFKKLNDNIRAAQAKAA